MSDVKIKQVSHSTTIRLLQMSINWYLDLVAFIIDPLNIIRNI